MISRLSLLLLLLLLLPPFQPTLLTFLEGREEGNTLSQVHSDFYVSHVALASLTTTTTHIQGRSPFTSSA